MIKSASNFKSLGMKKLNVGYCLLGVCEKFKFCKVEYIVIGKRRKQLASISHLQINEFQRTS